MTSVGAHGRTDGHTDGRTDTIRSSGGEGGLHAVGTDPLKRLKRLKRRDAATDARTHR